MRNNTKYKKCPYCELNYIQLEDECCKFCYSQSQTAREAVQLKKKNDFEKKQKENEQRLAKENESRKSLLKLLKGKGFIGFLRTDNFDNFINIYKSGYLKSRYLVLEDNIQFMDNADPEVIAHTSDFIKKHVRFYFRYQTPTNYGACYYYGQRNPVMMVFDENLIFDENAIIFDGNAMASYTRQTKDANFALENYNWDEIFSFGPFNPVDLIMKNHRNAEFLLPDQISIKLVKNIYFKYQSDLNKAVALFGNDTRFEYNPKIFF